MANVQTVVPFIARGTFQPDGGAIVCPFVGTVPAVFIGTGVMSHLGKTTFVVTWQTCTLNAQGQITATGVLNFAGANGDAVEGTFTQTFTLFSPVISRFDLAPIVITGGTGRFAGATGSARGNGSIDEAALQGVFEISGTLTPPGIALHSSQ